VGIARAAGFLLFAMIFIRLAGSKYMPRLLKSMAKTGGVFFKGTRRIWAGV
jgi:hypothetical protein